MVSLSNKVTAQVCWHAGEKLKVVSSPTLPRDVTDQYRGRKEAISPTCPQLRVNGLIPPIEITAPDCTYQKLSCITQERQKLNVYPIPLTPPSTAFVSRTALYYPQWKYNLPLICESKPYKSKSSKVATFLYRYYVYAPPKQKKRLITRNLDWHSFVHIGRWIKASERRRWK